MYQFTSRLARAGVVAAGTLLGSLALVAEAEQAPAAGADKPAATTAAAEIDAGYKVSLNGFELGTFRFLSNVDHGRYTLNTDVELSALLGAFHWKGNTRSTGTLAALKPSPAGFLFEYASSSKAGSIRMDFGADGVENLAVQPFEFTQPEEVPLTRAHLKGVLDPLSAIMAITHVEGASPCGRKVPIFDGRQRFDLDLRYARSEQFPGTNETAIVCRIKYQPIAGYVPSEETRAMALEEGIEIAFRPVPSLKLMLPQRVVIPTPVGAAQLDLVQIAIKTAPVGQVASVD